MTFHTEATPTSRPAMTLAECWLLDQSVAFAATLLGTFDPFSEPRTFACARFLAENLAVNAVDILADSTLSLLSSISEEYHDYYTAERLKAKKLHEYSSTPVFLGPLAGMARTELARREAIAASGLNRVLLSHSVYVIKRQGLSAAKFFKWLYRAAPAAVPGIKQILSSLQHPGSTIVEPVEEALAKSRDSSLHTRDRLEQIDALHRLVLEASGHQSRIVESWWTSICIAYRSSLFRWPLLTEGDQYEEAPEYEDAPHSTVRGLSLPISLFLVEDGASIWRPGPNQRGQKVWFKYKLSRSEERLRKEPRFQIAREGLPAHISGFRLGLAEDWWQAFTIGMDAAKKLWLSRNGVLRLVDDEEAEQKLRASLNVDLRWACDIVESVFSSVSKASWSRLPPDKRYFTVAGRSAEAYWAQCVLTLLLRSDALPIGVCTGTLVYEDGEYVMGNVGGVAEKLMYANRAGFARVVIPTERRDSYGNSHTNENEQTCEQDDNSGPLPLRPSAEAEESTGTRLPKPDHSASELDVFLNWLEANGSRKTIDDYFASSAVEAADAMQQSGWRRTAFLRTPAFQREFSQTQVRLLDCNAFRKRRTLQSPSRVGIGSHTQLPWINSETKTMERLDRFLLSRTGRAVKHIKRADVRPIVPETTVEEALGKWAAWKDHELLKQRGIGNPGQALGLATLRITPGDNETQLWAALAEMLGADEAWWERFQWADLPQAADLLAQLLCNQHSDPQISQGFAPDLLIIFDDSGFSTRRTNPVFPSEFRHQFFDILNPRHPTNNKPDYLDAALKRHAGNLRDLQTRVIVVDEETETNPVQEDVPLAAEESALLERLMVFRYGFSRHAGYSMAHFDAEKGGLSWTIFEQLVQHLGERGLLSVSRNILYVSQMGRAALGSRAILGNPLRLARAHQHAAFAFCPILYPNGTGNSSNRDRQLEPENVLEANWHLRQAASLIPKRFRSRWLRKGGLPILANSQSLLDFLRISPDWDVVKRLRLSSITLKDSVDLALELMNSQRIISNRVVPAAVVGLAIETMGYEFRNDNLSEDSIDEKATEIVAMVDLAIENLKEEKLTKSERQRRLRHLLSRQIFALRMLGLPLTDSRMAGARSYIDNAVTEILKPDFLSQIGEGREGLDDFPISKDCWRTLWFDGNRDTTPNKTLSLGERSRYAYAAALANLSKTRPGSPPTEPWDEPWIAYFVLARPEDVDPRQIAAPLNRWWAMYGTSKEASLEFGKRVIDMLPHAQRAFKGKGPWEERWLADIGEACSDLWLYVTHPSSEQRLVGAPVAPALRLIASIALQETLSAWRLAKVSGPEWLDYWPSLVLAKPGARWPAPAAETFGFVAEEWSALGRAVVGHKAGWTAMLANLANFPDDRSRIAQVMNWLRAHEAIGGAGLQDADPENLIRKARQIPLVVDFLNAQRTALANARALLALRNDRGFALYGHYRWHFEGLVRLVQS